jgi:hypothetical protein
MGEMAKLKAVPVALKEANKFIDRYHRHNGAVLVARFAVGATCDGELIGVAIVGNPIARLLAKEGVAEVVRLCVIPGAPLGSCSFLYARCWRIWEMMGGRKLITYTLQSESGSSLRGAGWSQEALIEGGGWDRPNRRRVEQAISQEPKIRWSKEAV